MRGKGTLALGIREEKKLEGGKRKTTKKKTEQKGRPR